MPNHVHHVVIPSTADALHQMLKAVHGQYSQRINRMTGKKGHLWQGRYFSSALDANYFVNAVRYVELNPVRARMVARAEDYAWSSAAVHCGLRSDLAVDTSRRHANLTAIADWSRWLAQGVADDSWATLRRNGNQNLPCGGEDFVSSLEAIAGRSLRFQKHGGKRDMATSGSLVGARCLSP